MATWPVDESVPWLSPGRLTGDDLRQIRNWLDRDQLAHPQSPCGGGGFGGCHYPARTPFEGAPHPLSPSGRSLTYGGGAARVDSSLLDRIRHAASIEHLEELAKWILGAASFDVGVIYGMAKNITDGIVQLLVLLKTVVFAGIYGREHEEVNGWWENLDPGHLMAQGLGLLIEPELHAAHEEFVKLMNELRHAFTHPGEFVREIGRSYYAKWERMQSLLATSGVRAHFIAGEIAGELLMDLILLIVGAGEAALRLAGKLPEIASWARRLTAVRRAERVEDAALEIETQPGEGASALAARDPARLAEGFAERARPAEVRTAERLASEYPEFDGRTFEAPPPPDPGYDWKDDLGRTYDAMGDGTKANYFRLQQFTDSIDSHLLKGNDFTVIDMTGYRPEQIADVKRYIDALPESQQNLIRRVGF